MNARIFIAVPVPADIQQTVASWQEAWRDRLPVRWIAGRNLHLTLIAPWTESNVRTVTAQFDPLGKFEPFEVTFSTISFGPSQRAPRLVWATGPTPPELVNLVATSEEHFKQPTGFRPVLLHLTLARFNPADFPSFPAKQLDEKVDWRMTVDSVALMESRPTPSGSEYRTLASIQSSIHALH